ncbi:hypothetical protein FQA39_LY00935 [Lamprigera yunnana]|nr:hypothetical protein FQA39_LY00935 [Lamprigera yunnana]
MSLKKESLSDAQLHLAAMKGDEMLLRRILDSGKVHTDCKDKDGTTPLILASANGHYECVKELLEQGADPTLKRVTGTTALFFAAQGGFLDIVQILLENNAPVNTSSVDGGSPLFVACQCGHMDVVKELIEKGAKVNTHMKDKATPLFIAAQNGHYKILVYLLAQGAEPDSRRTDGATPLWIAAQMGHDHIVSQLLKSGARVDAARHDGATALFKAAHKGHSAVLTELLRYKPSLGLLPNGESALHAAALFGHLTICKQLISAGADPTLLNQDNLTPSMLAADHKHNIESAMSTISASCIGELETVVKQGWMMKKDERLRIWKSRYYVLKSNGSLLEFISQDDYHENILPKGEINVAKFQMCPLEDFDYIGFILRSKETPNETALSFSTEKAMSQWMKAMNLIMHGSKRGEGVSRITLEDFEILKTLGRGSFGKVFLCKETYTNEIYAIKVLKKTLIVEQSEVDHILTENKILKSTNHPFLTSLKYSFQSENLICFVMEYVNGGDLFFHLGKERVFTEEKAKFYAAETILALSYLHSLKIIYRDLKSENVVLDRDGHIKLVDFGLCKENINHEREPHTFCGTPEYMAPEVLVDGKYGRGVDWWGVGIITYEMICGRLPFYNKDYEILIRLITMKAVEFPGFVSLKAQDLIAELLIKNPRRRLGSGPNDAEDVKKHVFFKGINWEALEQKEIAPPFKPQLIGATDTQYFDPEFTSEIAQLTVSHKQQSMETAEDYFQNFSFQDLPDFNEEQLV